MGPQIVQDIMAAQPANVTAVCTGDLAEMAAAAQQMNFTTPMSDETLHGDQMGAFAHSVRPGSHSATGMGLGAASVVLAWGTT